MNIEKSSSSSSSSEQISFGDPAQFVSQDNNLVEAKIKKSNV